MIPATIHHFGSYIFEDCSSLESVVFVPRTTASIELGRYMFIRCYDLRFVTLPTNLRSIPHSCFEDCILLTHLHLPESVQLIERVAFSGAALQSVTLSENVRQILISMPSTNVPFWRESHHTCHSVNSGSQNLYPMSCMSGDPDVCLPICGPPCLPPCRDNLISSSSFFGTIILRSLLLLLLSMIMIMIMIITGGVGIVNGGDKDDEMAVENKSNQIQVVSRTIEFSYMFEYYYVYSPNKIEMFLPILFFSFFLFLDIDTTYP
mmetsp:Transcript_27915/g.31264  ORF Transcript_27915/g.31264 Transcript_27915/m.31264 type:complete len:263 (+) Transcript_27915:393-1181(+)